MPVVYNVWLVDFELRQMAGYLNFLKKSFTDYMEELEGFKMPEDDEILESDEFNEQFNRWYAEVASADEGGDYRRRFYSAFVISWYAFFEESLLNVCKDQNLFDEYRGETGKEIGKGIWFAKDLLQKFTPYRFDQTLWKELVLINKIRNSLAHNSGKFAYSLEIGNEKQKVVQVQNHDEQHYVYIEEDLYKYLNRHGILHFYGTYFIRPTHEYCEHLIKIGQHTFANLFRRLGLL